MHYLQVIHHYKIRGKATALLFIRNNLAVLKYTAVSTRF